MYVKVSTAQRAQEERHNEGAGGGEKWRLQSWFRRKRSAAVLSSSFCDMPKEEVLVVRVTDTGPGISVVRFSVGSICYLLLVGHMLMTRLCLS